jgi:hypothetical protein
MSETYQILTVSQKSEGSELVRESSEDIFLMKGEAEGRCDLVSNEIIFIKSVPMVNNDIIQAM